MLQKLIIRNYAIIENLTLEPAGHLNIITGETGAGKSIMLGALSLILGERADTSVLINKNEKCIVEAHFNIENNSDFRSALQEQELDEEELCIIRREISASGKSRAFINDTPVNLNTLNKLTSLLVDLHQQFGHLELENDHFQLDVVDAIAKAQQQKHTYNKVFQDYKKVSRQLSELKTRQAQWQKEADYKQFIYEELSQAAFKENEIEDAEQQLKQLAHGERIMNVLQVARMTMEEGEQPLVNEIRRISQQLQGIADVLESVTPLQERLASVYAELKDVASELSYLEDKVNLDPALMQQLQERVDTGYKLCKKHGVMNTQELLEMQSRLEKELKTSLNLSESIEKLEKEKEQFFKGLLSEAQKLSESRKSTAPVLSEKINELLQLVGMPNARLKIEVLPLSEPSDNGMDEIRFLLDANKSGQFLPVYKAASGGEMSRIMLCIKSLTARAMHLPTLIFDEVDTGISGEAARQVGVLLQNLGQHHQVICITHQPQVAAKGERHYFIYKELDNNNRITTRVRTLKPEERIRAIAQMIGGESPSEAALQNARELVAE